MLSTAQNRLDPSNLTREELDRLAATFSKPDHVALIKADGTRVELPAPLFDHLMRIVHTLRQGSAVVMLPEDETFTTQAAANFLGMSRQSLVNLLQSNRIPFHSVGAHRRIYFKDLLAYREERDKVRRNTLDDLGREIRDAGLYFPHSEVKQEDDQG